MSNGDGLSDLIGDIYDTALDPTLWPGVLEKLAGYVGGSSAGLFGRDAVRRNANPYYDIGISPHYKKLYFDSYSKLDPLQTTYFFLEVGDVISTSRIIPYAEFVETRFYREWASPQGLVDNVLVLLEKSSTSIVSLFVGRHERDGLADDAARERLRLLVPHLRRAVTIGGLIDSHVSEAAAFSDALNSISAGLFLVDAAGRLVHANAAGRAMLTAEDVLRLPAERLISVDRAIDRSLRDIFVAAGRGTSVGSPGSGTPLTGADGQPYVAHTLPLTSGLRRTAGAGYAATAAVFVRKAQIEAPAMPEVIAKLYGLTPSELRVLLAIFESSGVPDVAAALGISQPTAKTHLRRLFEKTGTKRQADLVKLVAGFSG